MIERRGNQPLGLAGDVLRGQDGAGAYHRLGHFPKQVELAVAQRMVHQRVSRLRGQARHSHQVKQREVLGACPGDAVDRAQFAHAVGRAHGPDAANAGVSVKHSRGGLLRFEPAANAASLSDCYGRKTF
jgi:hypothetical protein